MAVQAGDTFLLPLNYGVVPHLWVILTDPDENGEVLGANLTSHDVFKDTTVTLEAGEHPFIRRKTVVNYPEAKIIHAETLESSVERGYAEQKEPCSPELLKKIRDGVFSSEFTPQEKSKYLKKRLGLL